MRSTFRQAAVALRLVLVMTVLLGILYPMTVLALGRLVATRADGAMVKDAAGSLVGSELIGQQFEGRQWFHPRPSAAGSGYDAMSSSGSNLAADNPELIRDVATRKAEVAAENGVPVGSVPADAVTASGSGLDPDISPAYAAIQVARVARARGLSPAFVEQLVAAATDRPALGFLGEPGVNVLNLNLALAAA